MTHGELHTLTASECSELLSARKISAVDLLKNVLQRYERLNPALNAIVAVDLPSAKLAARQADERIAEGRRLGPLDGIPVTVKDNIGVRGMKATWGSLAFRDHACDEDDLAVARLRDAGAVIWGKTNLPEFAMAGFTDNKLFGVTKNPWDLSLTPGGSSGGAAAALAAGIGPLALTTDAGGSARRPAAYTNLVGFRPSNSFVPRRSVFPTTTSDCQVVAPMARTVADLQLMLQAIAGPDICDRMSALHMQRNLSSKKPLRIHYIPTAGGQMVESEIAEATRESARLLADMGHEIDQQSAAYEPEEMDRIFSTLMGAGAARIASTFECLPGELTEAVGAMIERGRQLTAADYCSLLDDISMVRAAFDQLFMRYDILLCPTSPCFAWPIGEPFPKTIAGQPAGRRAGATFAPFVNVAGLPAISIPRPGRRPGTPPIGVQLVAPFGRDCELLALAGEIEKAAPFVFKWSDLAVH